MRWGPRAGFSGICAGLLAALAMPVAAQQGAQQAAEPTSLKELIPDSALAKPEDWAKNPTPLPSGLLGESNPPATPEILGPPVELRPDSPMADIAGLDLPWPDGIIDPALVPKLASDATDSPLLAQTGDAPNATPTRPAARETVMAAGRAHLVWTANVPEREALEARFRALSALQGLGKAEVDALTQVVVRGSADRKVLEKLLRIYGYYDGEVAQSLINDPKAGEQVRFDLDAGQRYTIGAITLGDLDTAPRDAPALTRAFALNHGDPLSLDAITAASTRLATALGEAGYPFATLPTPDITVDHAQFTGDLDIALRHGGKYRYGAITSNLPRFLSPRHLADIARFKKGRTFRKSEVEDLRRAILATGIVGGVTVTPREAVAPSGERPGVVALDVVVAKAPLHTLTGEIGYDTGEGFRIAGSLEHRNLFPPEGAAKVRGILGTNEQLAGLTFRRSNFMGRDRVLTLDLYADNANLTAYAARKVVFAATYERQTTVLFQKPWVWSSGLEVQASEEREGVPSGVTTGRKLYITTALPLRAGIDSTDDLLDPRRGHRASLRISPENSAANDTHSTYFRLQGDVSGYWAMSKPVLIAGRLRLGSMPGTAVDNVAPSRRFYAGGGASIRGYGYQLVGPRNALGEPKGGRSLYEFSLEARSHTGLFNGSLDLVPFLDAGGVETGTVPRFNDWRFGAGVGLRYRTGFGPIRVDVGTPLNPRNGDSRVGVYVALGQAF